MLVFFLYFETFASMIYLIFFAIVCTFCLEADVFPVTITSMSIFPVFGSVAACCIAIFIKSRAYCTSSSLTVSQSFILAKASLSLISDSSCLGVAVIVFVLAPTFLISVYASTNFWEASYEILGCIYYLAKVIYLVSVSLE